MGSLNLSILIVNNFYCVINYLNINHIRIYREKWLVLANLSFIVRLCSLKQSCFLKLNSAGQRQVSPYKLYNKILDDLEKWKTVKNLFIHLSRNVYTLISVLHKMFLLPYYLMVWWWLQMKARQLANVSNKEM